jgi:hypothetical protein
MVRAQADMYGRSKKTKAILCHFKSGVCGIEKYDVRQ